MTGSSPAGIEGLHRQRTNTANEARLGSHQRLHPMPAVGRGNAGCCCAGAIHDSQSMARPSRLGVPGIPGSSCGAATAACPAFSMTPTGSGGCTTTSQRSEATSSNSARSGATTSAPWPKPRPSASPASGRSSAATQQAGLGKRTWPCFWGCTRTGQTATGVKLSAKIVCRQRCLP